MFPQAHETKMADTTIFHWPLAGYLIAFLTIFLEAASPRSMPHISDNLMRYSNTSDSSSPRCSLSDSSQLGKPLSTSPLHWNISDSSPTSPTYTWDIKNERAWMESWRYLATIDLILNVIIVSSNVKHNNYLIYFKNTTWYFFLLHSKSHW